MTTQEFNSLPKNEKAILVVEDVLIQLERSKYVAAEGNYLKIWDRNEMDDFNVSRFKTNDIKSNFEEIPICRVCAIGSMLLSCTHLGNVLTFNDLDFTGTGLYDLKRNEKIRELFNSIFDEKTLTLIETSFENSKYDTGMDNYSKDVLNIRLHEDELNACDNFYNKYHGSRGRLIAICNNIIKNNGTFIL